MIRLSDLRLNTHTISEQVSIPTFKVLSASVQRDANGSITGCTLTCRVIDGIRQNFKLPASASQEVEKLKEKLDNGGIIRVKFGQLQIRAFAFLNDSGQLLSGVSTKAQSFAITSEEEAGTGDIDISDIEV